METIIVICNNESNESILTVKKKTNSLITLTGTAVLVTYLWHITFFGGCMALSGYMEKGQRHGITCRRVKPKSEAGWYNGKEEFLIIQ